jgi:hypothetical protein
VSAFFHPIDAPVGNKLKSAFRLDLRDLSDGAPAWSPANLGSNLLQNINGLAYSPTLIGGLPVVPSTVGTLAQPRGQRCALFDGTDDYATRGARLTTGTVSALTACCWIRFSSVATSQVFMAENSSQTCWRLIHSTLNAGKLTFLCSANGATVTARYAGATTISDGNWHHIAVVGDGSGIALFVDGVAEVLTTITAGVLSGFNGTQFFSIGQEFNGTVYAAPFTGSMRDVRVYSVVKTAGEVAAIFNQANTPTTLDRTGLLGAWWMQEEAGTIHYDWSGNGRHLTITNATLATYHATDAGVRYSGPNELGYSAIARITSASVGAAWAMNWTSSPSFAGDGWAEFIVPTDAVNIIYGLTTQNQLSDNNGFQEINYGFRALDGGFALGSLTGQNFAVVVGDIIRFTRTGTTVTISRNGAVQFAYATPSTGTLRATASLQQGMTLDCRSVNGQAPGFGSLDSVTVQEIVVPRNETTPAQDAGGAALHFAGPIGLPVTMEVPCITGDGVAYANLGATTGLIDEFDFWFFAATEITSVGDISLVGTDALHCFYLGNYSGTFANETLSINGPTTNDATFITANIPAGWNRIRATWTGTQYAIRVNELLQTTFAAISHCPQWNNRTLMLMAYNNAFIRYVTRIANFSYTIAGVRRTFPLQDGPGSSNTNRDLHWYASDGTGGVVAGAIIGGTVANIWANRTNAVRDACIELGGGIAANGAYVVGRTGPNDAAGNPKTLAVGQHRNPFSRFDPNNWSAPSLVNIGSDASDAYAPTDVVQTEIVVDTRFRRTGFARYLATRAALTGSNKTNAENWVA